MKHPIIFTAGSVALMGFLGIFLASNRRDTTPPPASPQGATAAAHLAQPASESALPSVPAHSFAPETDLPVPADLLTGAVLRLTSASPDARPLYPATERVYLAAGEAVRVPLNRAMLSDRSPVILRADHGGVLEGRPLSPQVELSLGADSFTFNAGAHRGRYTVSVQQGARAEMLEFWVGEEPPRGRPGPARVFTAPSNLSAGS